MLATNYRGPQRVRIDHKPMPEILHPEDATLRANQASVKRLLPRLIEHVQNGVLDPKALITHCLPLEDVSDAYRIFSAKLDECIKPCIKPVLMPPSVRA